MIGDLGIDKYHKNSWIPHKKSKLKPLNKQQKQDNKELGRQKMDIEHTFSMLKRFKIFTLPYGNRRKRFGLRFNLFAAIYNLEI